MKFGAICGLMACRLVTMTVSDDDEAHPDGAAQGGEGGEVIGLGGDGDGGGVGGGGEGSGGGGSGEDDRGNGS